MNRIDRVLLVDDDHATNFFNKMILGQTGYVNEIIAVQSGQEALDLLNTIDSWPDLILLDINMPAMNGWEFLEAYDKLEPRQTQPLVFILSTSLNPDDSLRAFHAKNITNYLSKPLSKEVIKSVIITHFK